MDFGEAWVQKAFHWEVPIQNTSARPIEISGIQTSCRCSAVDPQSLVVPANGSAKIRLTLDLTELNPDRAAQPVRHFSVRLTPIVAGLSERIEWQVQGRVRNLLGATPKLLFLGERSVRAGAFPRETVHVRSLIPLESLIATCGDRLGVVDVRASADELHEFELDITPRVWPVGTHEFPITLTGVARSGESLPSIRYRVIGQMVPDVEAVPASVTWGVVPIGERVSQTVVLRSRTKTPFAIERIECESRSVQIHTIGDGVPLHPQQSFRISQPISRTGFQIAQLRVFVRHGEAHADSALEAVAVPVRYVGRPAVERVAVTREAQSR